MKTQNNGRSDEGVKNMYETPNLEIITISRCQVITTSVLTEGGNLNWNNVEKPEWGQGSSW